MAKIAIVNSKKLADTRCWSSMRFTDSCERCREAYYGRCKVKEGIKGHIKILKDRLTEEQIGLNNIKKEIQDCQKKAKRLK